MTEDKHATDYFDEMLMAYQSARDDDGAIDFSEMLSIGAKLIALSLHVKEAWSTDEHFKGFLEEVEDIYDRYIKPIDIKQVPDIIENRVDEILKMFLVEGIKMLRERISQ